MLLSGYSIFAFGDSNILADIEAVLSTGENKIFPVYKSPFIEDVQQIKDTISYIKEDMGIKEIIDIRIYVDTTEDFKGYMGEVEAIPQESKPSQEEKYIRNEDGFDLIQRDDENRLITEIPKPQQFLVTILIDGKPLLSNSVAYVEEGRTYIPFVPVTQALNATTGYNFRNENLKVVWATWLDRKIDIKIGDRRAIVNGKEIVMDAPAVLKDGRTYIPLRYLTDLFPHIQLEWDNQNYIVNIVTKGGVNR